MSVKVKLKEGLIPPKSESIRKALQKVGMTFSEEKDGSYIVVTEEYLDKVFRMELVKAVGTTKAVSREKIKQWFQEGKKGGATHMIVLYNPDWFMESRVFVRPGGDVKKAFEYWDNHQYRKVMEVYSLNMDMETQLNETRAIHLD